MRPPLRAALLAAAAAVVPAAARAQSSAAPTPPHTETGTRAERRVVIGGTTLSMRTSPDGFLDATLTASADKLYAVLPVAFADVGLSTKEIDATRQQAGTGPFRAQYRLGKQRLSTFLDCGLDAMGLRQADSYTISMRVTTQIVPESADRATVRTLVQATGKPASHSGLDIHCPTTGRLEERLAEAIAARAQP